MFKRRPLAELLGAALGVGALISPAIAQQQLERVEVTGSAIKRTTEEGPAPLEVLTRKDIERTGATTVNELLRYIPAVDFFDQGELASNSPSASGTGSIRLRGLSENATLVLLNGRRLPVNALYDSSGAGAAVDVNTIPLAAIERIEVLKDGASAIYGADAIAGVVNFITKKNYQGAEARASYGVSSEGDGRERTVGVVGGFGDLDVDGFNILFSADHFSRDPIFRKDRYISQSSNYRRFGGADRRSSFAPEGNLLDSNFNFTGNTVRPCPADRVDASGICRYDFNASLLTAVNGADRTSAFALGTLKLTDEIRAYTEYIYSHSEDHFEAHPVPDFFQTASGDFYTGRFLQGGPRITDRESTLSHIAIGLEGATEKFDWKVGYSYGKSEVTNSDRNYYDLNAWNDAIAAGLFDATSSSNDPDLVESLKVTPRREGESILQGFGGQISSQIEQLKLPGGPVSFAIGASWQRETLTDTPDELTQAGEVVGSIQQSAVDAAREAKAAFLELSLPILEQLEGQFAIRHDVYPEASRSSPKFALLWRALPSLSFRTSYAYSFRPASLKQLYGASDQGAINVTDDESCIALGLSPGCNVPANSVTGANAELEPEKGKTFNFGVVFEPTPWFNGSIDYFLVRLEDSIATPTEAEAIRSGQIGRDSNGQLLVFQNLQNIAETEVDGLDIDLRFRFEHTPVGLLTIRNATTFYLHDRNRGEGDSEWSEFLGTYGGGGGPKPRWRNVMTFTSESGPWTTSLVYRSTSGFDDTDEPGSAPAGTRYIERHDEFDLSGSYSGFKDFTLSYGVKNLLDNPPPYSETNASDNNYTQQGYPEIYSPRGRFFYAGLNYKFK